MKIIAHRGASHLAPENTLAAVRLAWKHKADGVEIDVHVSRDGRIMVIHDPSTFRTTGRRGRVAQKTSDHLQQLDAGSWKAKRWAGEPIPRLEEVINLLPENKELLVEVKCGRRFLAPFARLIHQIGPRSRQLILIGFDLPLMRLLKKRYPKLRVLWVTALDRRRNWGDPAGPARHLIRQMRAARLDGVDLDARGPLSERLVEQFHAAGLLVYVWTVDSAQRARQLRQMGVDGLTTNRPLHLRSSG